MKHVMLDIETFGTRSNSVIATIGAVYFDLDTGELGDTFYKRIDIGSCCDAGLELCGQTYYWWSHQDEKARREVFEQFLRISLRLGLKRLSEFIKEDSFVWGNSARFDCGLIENAYHALGLEIPWKFYNERDVRTLVSFAPEIKEKFKREGIHHHALDDCYHQIKYCCEIYKTLKK